MMKQEYVAPELREEKITVEAGFAGSGDPVLWYSKPGSGDFNYDVENDDTWA